MSTKTKGTKAKKSTKPKPIKSRKPRASQSSSSGENDELTMPQIMGILIALVGVSIILGGIGDFQKDHPWWLFWFPAVDVIGIVVGLYLVTAGLVVLIVPPEGRGEAIRGLLRALEVTLRTIVLLARTSAHEVAEWERKRKLKKQEGSNETKDG
jgi:hypothetical protein